VNATIKDVARAAGVSFKTVSRVLNDDPAVKDITRLKVLQSFADLDYRPHQNARQLRTQKSNTIGFITDEIATTPHAVNIIKGAQHEAWQHNKLLLVVNTERDKEIEREALDMMLERRVEAIIYATMFHRNVFVPPLPDEMPVILLDCYSETKRYPSVVPDEVQGGRTATEKLIEKGHGRIAIITNDKLSKGHPAPKGRLEGYKQALQNAGIPFDKTLFLEGDSNANTGYECTLRLMRLKKPPTAIFCCTDRMAMGAYDALKELGLKIPEDVSVIGFDNEELIAAYLRPALTTIALPHFDMGQWAVKRLLSESDLGNVGKNHKQVFPCPFVERASLGSTKA
jgi:LacI family transcriptional regulator